MVLDKEKFKPMFHESWWEKIEPRFELLDPIYAEIKELSERGKSIFPAWQDVFRAFEYTDLRTLKAVVCGIGPYHTMKNKEIVADGVALSCSKLGIEQPSLTKWYDAMEKEYPEEKVTRETDLKFLCEQGVFMFNLGLTVESMKPMSHNDLWKPFIKFIFEDIISITGVPVILLGKEAHVVEKWLAPFQWSFKISHPASAEYSGGEWDSEGVFKKVERIVFDNTKEKINWWYEQATSN